MGTLGNREHCRTPPEAPPCAPEHSPSRMRYGCCPWICHHQECGMEFSSQLGRVVPEGWQELTGQMSCLEGRAHRLAVSGSGEQGAKPTNGLITVSLLWATLPSCLTHMSWGLGNGLRGDSWLRGVLTGSGTSECLLGGMVTVWRPPGRPILFSLFFLPSVCSFPLHSVRRLRKVHLLGLSHFLPTHSWEAASLTGHPLQVQ